MECLSLWSLVLHRFDSIRVLCVVFWCRWRWRQSSSMLWVLMQKHQLVIGWLDWIECNCRETGHKCNYSFSELNFILAFDSGSAFFLSSSQKILIGVLWFSKFLCLSLRSGTGFISSEIVALCTIEYESILLIDVLTQSNRFVHKHTQSIALCVAFC